MAPPIVYYCLSYRDHLALSVYQSRVFNPDAEIILLGDATNDRFGDLVTHVNVYDYFDSALNFAKHFKHLSNNNYFIVLACIQRWFVLRDYMKARGIESVFHVDTDIMLYENVGKMHKYFQNVDFNFSYLTSGHSTFVNSLDALDAMCEFMLEQFAIKENLVKYEERFANKPPNSPGGIGDMTLIREFVQTGSYRFLDTGQPYGDNALDHNVNVADGFMHNGSHKTLFWKNYQPYGYHKETGRTVKFDTLHFQGVGKRLMPRFMTNNMAG